MQNPECGHLIRPIYLAAVVPGPFGRELKNAAVMTIAESMAAVGQQAPILVRPCPEEDSTAGKRRFELIAGRHRVEAARVLGWTSLFAFVIDADDDDARLIGIAENLHRADLNRLQRAEFHTLWLKTLLKRNRVGPDAHLSNQPHDAGVSAAARSLHVSRKRIRRSRMIAAIAPEAKAAAMELGLANRENALVAIAAQATPDEQLAKARDLGSPVHRRQATHADLPQRSAHVGTANADYEQLHMCWEAATDLRNAWEKATSEVRNQFVAELLREHRD